MKFLLWFYGLNGSHYISEYIGANWKLSEYKKYDHTDMLERIDRLLPKSTDSKSMELTESHEISMHLDCM